MIPLRDDIPAQKAPMVTVGLIVVNLAVFLLCALMPERERVIFYFHYGLIPGKIFDPDGVATFYLVHYGWRGIGTYSLGDALLPLFTSMFLHGGWIHVLGNMWILWIFGDNVEDCLGHIGYFVFYIVCGVVSAIAQTIADPTSPVVTVGASGAVAGVMGAYMVLYPRARVLALFPIFIFFYLLPVPAVLFLFFWFLVQFLSGVASLAGSGSAVGGGIALWAHIGGFILGAGFILIARIRPPRRPSLGYERKRLSVDPRTRRSVSRRRPR